MMKYRKVIVSRHAYLLNHLLDRTLLDVEPPVDEPHNTRSSGVQAGTVPLTIISGFLGAGKSTLIK